jgi:pyruvate formate lyase activating enzyme
VCPVGAHQIEGKKHEIDHARCIVCGKCAEACLTEAVRVVGRERTASEVIREVMEDRHYYATSGGGMTVSGGEPTVQIEFLEALLTLAKRAGISTAVDTNGGSVWERYERILPVTDLFLYDLKQMDEAKHKKLTGVKLETVLSNLRRISESGGEIQIRCPIIPEANAEDDEHWRKVAEVAKELAGVVGVEYLPYHRLWVSKSEGVGAKIDEEERELKEIPAERIEEIQGMLMKAGKPVEKG